MKREDVYKVINSERDYQDLKWNPQNDKRNTMADWVLYIEKHLSSAKSYLYDGSEFNLRAEIRKIAALAVACMEQENVESRDVVNSKFKVTQGTVDFNGVTFPGLCGTQLDIFLDSDLLRPGYVIAPEISKRNGIRIHTGPEHAGRGFKYGAYLVSMNDSDFLPKEYLEPGIEYILTGIEDTPWVSMIKGSEQRRREEFLKSI